MKYSQWIGIAAALGLIVACFLPWAWYPDLQKNFTGFLSEHNSYGRPGKFLCFLGGLTILPFLIPRIWAKRVNMMVCAITIAFAFKSYVLFTACYRGICPEKKEGIFLVVILPVIMMVCSVLPDLKVKQKDIPAPEKDPGA